MFLAGKNPIHVLRSLFRKKQAPSLLSPYAANAVEKAMERYEKEKLYCCPDTTLSEVAKRLSVHSAHIYRYFSSQGIDFRTWRTHLRIEEAKRLLLSFPDMAISDIGRRVGICDRSNFGKQFRRIVGDTPQNWRNSQK